MPAEEATSVRADGKKPTIEWREYRKKHVVIIRNAPNEGPDLARVEFRDKSSGVLVYRGRSTSCVLIDPPKTTGYTATLFYVGSTIELSSEGQSALDASVPV